MNRLLAFVVELGIGIIVFYLIFTYAMPELHKFAPAILYSLVGIVLILVAIIWLLSFLSTTLGLTPINWPWRKKP